MKRQILIFCDKNLAKKNSPEGWSHLRRCGELQFTTLLRLEHDVDDHDDDDGDGDNDDDDDDDDDDHDDDHDDNDDGRSMELFHN